MYQISRAIYRELSPTIISGNACDGESNQEHVLHACESAVERLTTDRRYFARPARTLFHNIRCYFPVCAQYRVWLVVQHYMAIADAWAAQAPAGGYDVNGEAPSCRATTRRGTPCQRIPLAHNGYCPSHQHLAETEDGLVHEVPVAA
ncbi:MAG: DUF5763 domain-containing protein [Solirubrobacterales bacterium]|nr:DUF5763 domain-containing protein [Solirubrobacterales bacterium]